MTDTEPVSESRLLPGLIQRPPELGRIRMGDKSERGLPMRLKTFRLTSHSKATLDAAAALYGGTVRAWTDAPDEGMWELITERDELDILIPATLGVINQTFELWAGGAAERRCDGTTEQLTDSPCICAAEGLEGPDRPCDIVTRLRVMLPRVPGLGVWRLDTSGYVAATTLPATVQLLSRLTPGAWIPAVLRAEQRSKKTRDGGKLETHRFVVPVIDLPGTTIGEIVGDHRAEAAELPAIAATTERPTAADRAAARRAQIEAGGSGTGSQTGADAPAGQASGEQGSTCGALSPRGEPCELAPHDVGDHRAGNKTWGATTKQAQEPAGRADEGQERGRSAGTDEPARQAAAGVVPTPAADLIAGENDPALADGMRLLNAKPVGPAKGDG